MLIATPLFAEYPLGTINRADASRPRRADRRASVTAAEVLRPASGRPRYVEVAVTVELRIGWWQGASLAFDLVWPGGVEPE